MNGSFAGDHHMSAVLTLLRATRLGRCAALLILLLGARAVPSPAGSREESGAPRANVFHENGAWTIRGQMHDVTLHESDLALHVNVGAAHWDMTPSTANEMLVRYGNKEFGLRLADARKI